MECLVAFVVLLVLPLAAAGVLLAWRSARLARRVEREARAELARLGDRLAALERGGEGPRATAPAGPARVAAAPATRSSPADATDAVAASAPVPAAVPAAPPAIREAPTAPPGAPFPTVAAAGGFTAPLATPGDVAPSAAPPASIHAATPAPGSLALPPGAPRVSLEERLGARLPVWIGAAALVLAVGYLVKYSFDRGWIGPAVRVLLGTGFGLALLGGGELLRRSAARVAQGLAAAGVAALFVVQWAAMELYELVPPATGFALLAGTTALAVALSLRHGILVALLGLVGGFLTPALVATPDPDPRPLFAWLLLLQCGLLAVSRRRSWSALAALNLAACLGWTVAWLAGERTPGDVLWIGGFLVATLGAFLLATGGAAGSWSGRAGAWLRGAAAAGTLLVCGVLAGTSTFSLLSWGYLGVLAAGCLVLARLRAELEGLAWLAAGVFVVLLGVWGFDLGPPEEAAFLGVAAASLLLLAGGPWLLRRGASRPARWAALAATSTLAIDAVAYATLSGGDLELPWGALQLALAAVWVLMAVPVWRRRGEVPSGEGASAEGTLAAAAVAATTLAALAAPIELEREWIGVAWALGAAALVWLAGRLAVPVLARLAAVLGALVAARLLLNPLVLAYEANGSTWPAAGHPVLSWVLQGYGVPLAAFAAAAALARRQGRPRLGSAFGAGAVALAAAGLALAVRQAFHPGTLEAPVERLAEWGALTLGWLGLGVGLLAAAARAPASARLPELRWGGAALVTLAPAQALLCQGLGANPAWTHLDVGALPVLNALLLAFGVPAALVILGMRSEAALAGDAGWSRLLRRGWGGAALLLLFLLVTLEVRQAFRGRFLDVGDASHAERYAYSAAWVALATALLIAGIASGRRALRLASLPVMLLAVVKVFLWDTEHLTDLYRVLSFLGLGASLLFLAWVYQRFVFRAPAPSAQAPQ